MVFPLALLTYSLHLLVLARASSRVYSFAFARHAVLSISCLVRLYTFLSRFASRRRLVSCSFHQRLLWGLGFLRGVVSSIAFVMAVTSCFAKLSTSMYVVVSSIEIGFGRY